ncbi:LuxR C-terminal-related transcriptional regulator [Streptomyces sp. NPDC002574]|uniref:LuxR C-terminal-related transcriptional regulator n=1 Tax=Streptomyces sp. NPDC002574 TaxID=3364652 RepID=UPI0036AA0F22
MSTIPDHKLHPPVRPPWFVPRPRLLSRLDAFAEPVVVVSAPPGAGKSVLLAEWARALRARGSHVAWFGLDAYDNTPARLWTGILAALRPFRPGLPVPPPAGAWTRDVWAEDLLPRTLAGLAGGRRLTLVLDGVERLTDAALRSLGDLLTGLPDGLRVVPATRYVPGAPVPGLRARGLIGELGPADLRFAPDEADTLLTARSGGRPMDEERRRGLYDLAEGWAAGLFVMASAGGTPEHAFESSADEPSPGRGAVDRAAHAAADYLTTEVLDRLTTEQRAFLLRTSVLDELRPDACRAVAGTDRAGVLLRELARTVRFLVPTGTAPGAYRCHRALRALLSEVLEAEHPEGTAALHRAAADWYRAAGQTTSAVRHFARCGDSAAVVAGVLDAWEETIAAGRAPEVAGWLDLLPARVVRADARLCVVATMTELSQGEVGAAARWLELARARPCGADTVGEGSSVTEATTVAHALVRCLRGESGTAGPPGGTAVVRPEPFTPWRALACVAGGTALMWQGRWEEAEDRLREAVGDAHAARHALVLVRALGSLALCAYLTGERGQAAELADEALRTARSADLTGHFVAVPAHLCRAGLLLEDARAQEAGESLARGEEAMAACAFGGEPHQRALARAFRAALPRGAGDDAVLPGAFDGVAGAPALNGLLARLGTLRVVPVGRAEPPPQVRDLSPGERRILRALCGPLTLREIADELHVSRNTVKTQVRAVFKKLDAHSRSGAVARARECGVLQPGPATGTRYEASCRRA